MKHRNCVMDSVQGKKYMYAVHTRFKNTLNFKIIGQPIIDQINIRSLKCRLQLIVWVSTKNKILRTNLSPARRFLKTSAKKATYLHISMKIKIES